MIQKRLSLTVSEIKQRLALVEDAFLLSDEDRTHFGAYADNELHDQAVLDKIDEVFRENYAPDAGQSSTHLGERQALAWVVVLPYEAFRGDERCGLDSRTAPLVSRIIARHYPATVTVDEKGATLFAETTAAAEKLEKLFNQPVTPPGVISPLKLTEVEGPDAHLSRIELALEQIRAGELYQVNLARRFLFEAQGSALQILSQLGPAGEAPFSAALNEKSAGIISTSPELFLDLEPSGQLTTRPIKGTRPRGLDPEQDARLCAELDADEKERAELAMVIDIERNDLGKLAETGSVVMNKSPHIVTYPTVHHREAEVRAQLKEGVPLSAVLKTMMPSGSVTGAPKIAAMDCIARTESVRRGLYTGALGYLTTSGRLRLSMAIRTLTLKDGVAHYFAGGGIVADSQPAMEVEETLWKAAQLGAKLTSDSP